MKLEISQDNDFKNQYWLASDKAPIVNFHEQQLPLYKEIVKRVNLHDELIEALNRLYHRAKIYGAFADVDDYNGRALQAAEAMLLKAKATSNTQNKEAKDKTNTLKL